MCASLDDSLSNFKDAVADCIRHRRQVFVTTHNDCDGIASGAIITKSLIRAGARCVTSTTGEFNQATISALRDDESALHIITDLGGGFAADLDRTFDDRWFVLDHHQIPDSEMDNDRIINAWRYGMDGGTQISAGGMTYLASLHLDNANEDLSVVAVVSALGDRQDSGDKRSFVGKNTEILKTATDLNLVKSGLELLLLGRSTRPIHESIAYTLEPSLGNVAGSKNACKSMLESAKISLKEGGRWRVPDELTDQEQKTIIKAIADQAPDHTEEMIEEKLTGYTYTLLREQRRSFLRDGREYATMLNSCGRLSRSGVGISICMGDRDRILQEGKNIREEYSRLIRDCMDVLSSQRWRRTERPGYIMINADDVVPESLLGIIASMISGQSKNAQKIIILRAAGQNRIKFSCRKAFGCRPEVNLGTLMSKAADRFGGNGGGHAGAAGASITKDKLEAFLDYLESNVDDVQPADSP